MHVFDCLEPWKQNVIWNQDLDNIKGVRTSVVNFPSLQLTYSFCHETSEAHQSSSSSFQVDYLTCSNCNQQLMLLYYFLRVREVMLNTYCYYRRKWQKILCTKLRAFFFISLLLIINCISSRLWNFSLWGSYPVSNFCLRIFFIHPSCN